MEENENEDKEKLNSDNINRTENSNIEGESEEGEDDMISKHKIRDKHKLSYDSIFKGKKLDETEEDFMFDIPKQENFDFDVSSNYYAENKTPEDYNRIKQLRKDMYEIVVDDLGLNIKTSRRKPGRVDFNNYMEVLTTKLDTHRYSHSEIFIEFAYYFSDNIVNMFKLLDKKYGGKIAEELKGKSRLNLDGLDFQ